MRQSQPCRDAAIRLVTHVSEQLRGVLESVIGRIRVDQHGRGVQLGRVGHLGEGNGRKQRAC